MDNHFYYVSLVITSESKIIKNEMLRIDKPMGQLEAEEFDATFQEWVKTCPFMEGEPEFLVPMSTEATSDDDDILRILDTNGKFEFYTPKIQDSDGQLVTSGPLFDWATNRRRIYDGLNG